MAYQQLASVAVLLVALMVADVQAKCPAGWKCPFDGKPFDVRWRHTATSDTVRFSISHNDVVTDNRAWVGVGFNNNTAVMAGSKFVECFENYGKVKMLTATAAKHETPEPDRVNQVTAVGSSTQQGSGGKTLKCSFDLPLAYFGRQSMCLMAASGTHLMIGDSPLPRKHKEREPMGCDHKIIEFPAVCNGITSPSNMQICGGVSATLASCHKQGCCWVDVGGKGICVRPS